MLFKAGSDYLWIQKFMFHNPQIKKKHYKINVKDRSLHYFRPISSYSLYFCFQNTLVIHCWPNDNLLDKKIHQLFNFICKAGFNLFVILDSFPSNFIIMYLMKFQKDKEYNRLLTILFMSFLKCLQIPYHISLSSVHCSYHLDSDRIRPFSRKRDFWSSHKDCFGCT